MADAEAITPQTHSVDSAPPPTGHPRRGYGRWPLATVGGAGFVGYKINRLDSGDRFRTASAPLLPAWRVHSLWRVVLENSVALSNDPAEK
jgi:hypothetical protein